MDQDDVELFNSPEYSAMYNAARDKLHAAIVEFFGTIDPGEYVHNWLVLAHKLSPELELSNQSAVGVHGSADMTFVERRGIIEVALDGYRL